MNPRRLAMMGAALFGTAILVSGVIAAVASFGMADVKNADAAGIEDHAAEKVEVTISNPGSASAHTAVTAITETALRDASQVSASETPSVQPAAVSSDLTYTDKETVISAKILDESLPDSSQTLERETPPVQVATASTSDRVDSSAKEAASAATLDEQLPDSSQALVPATPPDGNYAVTSTETLDECLTSEPCMDQYLWAVYQRAPKEDAIKMVERTKVIVKTDGKPRTVVKEFTT